MAARIEPLITVDDLDLMPDDGNRYELIEGELIVSRAPSRPHQHILTNLLVLVKNFLAPNPCGIIVPTPSVIFDKFNAAIPDIVFISNERIGETASGNKAMGAPDWAIAISSPGAENARRDRLVKLQTDSKFSVKEYWIVDDFRRMSEIYRRADGALKLFETAANESELTSPLLPNSSCQAQQVFEG